MSILLSLLLLAEPSAAPSPLPPAASSPAPDGASSAAGAVPATGVTAAAPAPRYFTAGALKSRCEDPQAQSVSSCFAFVAAVFDTSRAYQQWMNFREFCVPADVTQGELRTATLSYVDLHPREKDAQAASVVVLALKDRFPCPVTPVTDPAPAPAVQAPPATGPATAPVRRR